MVSGERCDKRRAAEKVQKHSSCGTTTVHFDTTIPREKL